MANPGDKVEILTEDKSYRGMLMPRPELLNQDVVVIKLNNGYNIGIDKKRIKEMNVIKEFKEEEETKEDLPFDEKLPTVVVLSTGGTIASKIDYRTGGVNAKYTAADYIAMAPELKAIANLKPEIVMEVMTEDMTHKHWQQLAEAVVNHLNDPTVTGVVITMGTDILHFVAAALSFFIKDINKPVMITAAQRSIDRGSSDAFMNLICATQAAAKLDYAGVGTCLHGTTNDDYCLVIRGTKVRKMHTSRRDAFRPINDFPLAKVFQDGTIEPAQEFMPRNTKKAVLDSNFNDNVALIQVYPGMDPGVIDYYVSKGCKGIILSATALGHVPVHGERSLLPSIKKGTDKGVHFIIASQTLYGRTNPSVYTNLRMLSLEYKCIFVEDMLPEVAYLKLGWVLAKTQTYAEVKKLMLTNIAKEINERHEPEMFLY